jgi:hypothetical protein
MGRFVQGAFSSAVIDTMKKKKDRKEEEKSPSMPIHLLVC